MSTYEGMTCQDCKRGFNEVMDFLVADPIWNYVMGDREQTTYTIREGLFDKRLMARSEGVGGVVCLACFDGRARTLGIEYRDHALVFGVDCWMGGHYNGGVPLVRHGLPPATEIREENQIPVMEKALLEIADKKYGSGYLAAYRIARAALVPEDSA